MNQLCNQEQGKLSSQGTENAECSQNIQGESLISDFKPSDFEIFKTELGFQLGAESVYWCSGGKQIGCNC